ELRGADGHLGVKLVGVADRDALALERDRGVAVFARDLAAREHFHFAARIADGDDAALGERLERGAIDGGPLHDQRARLALLDGAGRVAISERRGRWGL